MGISRAVKADNGFLLLEILLVLLILAGGSFALLVKIPGQRDGRNLATASTRMLEELREARFAAMSENISYQVNFYPDTNTYQITRAGTLVKDVALPEGVVYLDRPSVARVTFNAAGAPGQGTTITLGTADRKQSRKIIVAPVGGRIREQIP
ncbi:MAG: prepilin-type cleavage/methylation domain-containing protein [Peptococcaceae bacterium]|jgi:type II secretory pathway pseudopilin PulG|nr:prepilin-type cleavage/methylation domain-containing protein [Peptococcaceae bacterium]